MQKVKQVALRVRREYFGPLKSHDKNIEFRRFCQYWAKALEGAKVAVLLCGKDVHRRWIKHVDHIPTPLNFSEQGKKDVPTATCFAIHLGGDVNEKKE